MHCGCQTHVFFVRACRLVFVLMLKLDLKVDSDGDFFLSQVSTVIVGSTMLLARNLKSQQLISKACLFG